jgi:hypothetical protein
VPLDWYGLDADWRGPRRLGELCTDAEGGVQYGILEHGDRAAGRPGVETHRRRVSVMTMALLPRRAAARLDGSPAGFIEAATLETAAAVAGIRLLDEQWPWHLDAAVRQEWLDQQRELALQVADRLGTAPWRSLALPVDGGLHAFHYRESAYGWVLVAATARCLLGAYGRGVSAYSLAFTRASLADYAEEAGYL